MCTNGILLYPESTTLITEIETTGVQRTRDIHQVVFSFNFGLRLNIYCRYGNIHEVSVFANFAKKTNSPCPYIYGFKQILKQIICHRNG